MEQDEVTRDSTMDRIEDHEELTKVAELIRPLPDNVIPSEEFLRRMRLRLLRLEGKSNNDDRRAA